MTKSLWLLMITLSSVLLLGCSEKIVPKNWELIAYVTEVYEPEPTDCKNITQEKNDLAYVKINKSTKEVISDSRAIKDLYTTVCTSSSPVGIRERKVVSKEECISYCTKKACTETNNIPGNKLNWSFEYADFESASSTCQCACTPYNTSKVVKILE